MIFTYRLLIGLSFPVQVYYFERHPGFLIAKLQLLFNFYFLLLVCFPRVLVPSTLLKQLSFIILSVLNLPGQSQHRSLLLQIY
jgi:hypothetical protein